MSKPKTNTLTKQQQKAVLKAFKETPNARKISDEVLHLPHRQIMLTLEDAGLVQYAPGSYN